MRNEKLTIFIAAEKLRLVRRYKTAISEFRRILEFDPEDAVVIEKIGDVYVEWQDTKEGLANYQNASNIYIEKKEREKALKCLNKILNLDSGKEFGYRNDAEEKTIRINKEIEEEQNQIKIKEEMEKQKLLQKEAQKEIVTLGSPLFEDCSVEELSEIVKVTNVVELGKGDILFRQGDKGDSLYLIDKGAMEVIVSKEPKKQTAEEETLDYIPEGQERILSKLEKGDFFGEISFLTGSNRTATLVAAEDTTLFEISREDFSEVLRVFPQLEGCLHNYYRERVLDLILAKSPLFSFLEREQRYALSQYFVLAKYNKGEVIIEEGSSSRDLYLVKFGYVKVISSEPSGKQLVLSKLHAHNFFGEVSFLTGKPRTASVIAATPLELLIFSYENLLKLVQQYPRIKEILQSFQKMRAFQTIKKLKMV